MHHPRPLPQLTTHPLSPANPIPLLIKILMHIIRRNPPPTARHRRRQPPIPRARKHATEPLHGFIVPLEQNLRAAVLVRVLLIIITISVLDRVRVEVGALRDGLEEEGGFGLGRGCGGCGVRGVGPRLRDERQLDRVEVVVAAAAAFGELELQVDGGVGGLGAGVERFDGVDADLLVGDGDAGFGGGTEYREVSGRAGRWLVDGRAGRWLVEGRGVRWGVAWRVL